MLGWNSTVTINRNEILGEGASSVVYCGKYEETKAAVRTFKRAQADTSPTLSKLAAIEKEAEIMVIRFWSLSVWEQVFDALLEEPAPPKDLRLKWLLGTALALKYLHEQEMPIVHRDLRPENILIHPSDQRGVLANLKLTTALSSHMIYSKKQGSTTSYQFYTPPEAANPEYKPSPKYDVFSFGMTVYCILTRHCPFEGRPNRLGTENYERIADPVADDEWGLIQRCWSQNEIERPSFNEICAEIKSWMGRDSFTPDVEPIISTLSGLEIASQSCEDLVELGATYYGQKEYSKAVDLFLNAAEQGNAAGQNWLGFCYEKGYGVTQDSVTAVSWYQKAADGGNVTAQCNLGISYQKGFGVDQDYHRAVSWYEKAAYQGNAAAEHNLGVCYENGWGVDQDLNAAVICYQKAADLGHALSQNSLDFCYEVGKGVVQDYCKAVLWYQKGVGNAQTQNNLGFCFQYGYGVPHDEMFWYHKAAIQVHAAAQNELGWCYEHGEDINCDYGKAVFWYRKAADLGNAAAQNNLGTCYNLGVGVSVDYLQAVDWYKKSADLGNASAAYNLGTCYEAGQGVSKDLDAAIGWYKTAAEQGDRNAIAALSRIEAAGNKRSLWNGRLFGKNLNKCLSCHPYLPDYKVFFDHQNRVANDNDALE
ncbi:Receptor-interacting serine/threonine-protein kinase 2 [Rhizoclosmatium sp. JEL0117]|nr:Receptor-interacting serine/threonine-protein kinase 2 [Rhizoclosmatium sp. JEL0117]